MSKETIKQDWSSLEAALESLREHMERIKELEAKLASITTCSGCGESSTKDGFLATYCLKCCEVASGKQTTHHWYDRSIHNNPDAQAWAKFFIDTLAEQRWHIEDIDEALMIGWFANAMMAMHYHTKRKWVELTDEEIRDVYQNYLDNPDDTWDYERAIEAKLKEKNT
jgi:hypothetical protein